MRAMRILTAFLLFVCLVGLSSCGGGGGGSGGGTGPVTPIICPQGSANPDGCAASPRTATVQHANFFSGYANQSGQSYATRPPWNVAGVDYPVGVYTAAGQLLDPTLAASLPAGCAFVAADDAVDCRGSGSLDVKGLDFSLHGGVRLHIYGGYTGTCTVEDNNFKNGASSDGVFGSLVRFDHSTCNRVIQSNTFDGNAAAFPGKLIYLVFDTGTGNFTSLTQYNAYLNCPQKCELFPASATITNQYNYVEDLELGPSHGEWDIYTHSPTPNPGLTEQYMTLLEPASPPINGTGGGITAMLYPVAGEAPAFTAFIDDGRGGGAYDGVAGDVMTVTANASDFNIALNQVITATGATPVAAGTAVLAIAPTVACGGLACTGAGGTGTYQVSLSQAIPPETFLSNQTVFSNLKVSHNVIVINTLNGVNPNGTILVSTAVELAVDIYTAAAFDHNYIDPTGAYYCYISTGNPTFTSPVTWASEIDLIDGSAITGFNGAGTCAGRGK